MASAFPRIHPPETFPPSKARLTLRVTLDRRDAEAEAQNPQVRRLQSQRRLLHFEPAPQGLFPWLAMRGQMPTCIPGMVYVRH